MAVHWLIKEKGWSFLRISVQVCLRGVCVCVCVCVCSFTHPEMMNRTTVRLREREQASDREDKLLIVWLIANSDSVSQKLCRVEPRHEDECEEESNNLINVTLCANKICHKPFYFILSNRTTFQHRNKQQNAYLVPQQQKQVTKLENIWYSTWAKHSNFRFFTNRAGFIAFVNNSDDLMGIASLCKHIKK